MYKNLKNSACNSLKTKTDRLFSATLFQKSFEWREENLKGINRGHPASSLNI
jgi:hypothetical protein